MVWAYIHEICEECGVILRIRGFFEDLQGFDCKQINLPL